jgi:hypothetical protein
MANSKIDFPALVSVINDLSDVLKTEGLTYKNLNEVVAVVGGIEKAKKLGFLGEFADIGMKNAGNCSYNAVNGTITVTDKEWYPKPYDTEVTMCSDDFEEKLGSPTLKNGVDRHDMRDTEVFQMFVDRFELAIQKMYWRLAFMSDVDAAGVDDSPAGYITAGVDLKLLNVCDGLFKKLRAILAVHTTQKITISQNAEATAALQNSSMSAANALAYANQIYYNAPIDIQTKMIPEGWVARCTQLFYNKLIQNFQGTSLDTLLINQQMGLEGGININGIPFVPVPEWDNMIQKYEFDGTKYREPYRVICTKPDYMQVGVPSFDTWDAYKVGFDERTDLVWIKIKDKIDTNFIFDNMIMAAI